MIQKLCVITLYTLWILYHQRRHIIATNVSRSCHSEKVSYKIDCYILHAVLLVIILLSIITIICYHYVKQRPKEKDIDALKKQNRN